MSAGVRRRDCARKVVSGPIALSPGLSGRGAVTATVAAVMKKNKPEPTAEQRWRRSWCAGRTSESVAGCS